MPDHQNTPLHPPWLLDSHCHLCSHAFDPDRGPVLGPEPGIRNEPANLGMVIDAIARIKKIDPAEVAQALADNSRHLYGTMPL